MSLERVVYKFEAQRQEAPYSWSVRPPIIPSGVVPDGVEPPVMGMDTGLYHIHSGGFPGFAHLAMLATLPEYRAMASCIATELTREWIEITSSQRDGGDTDKLISIAGELKRLNVRQAIHRAAENDCLYGIGLIYLHVSGASDNIPMILDRRLIDEGAFDRVAVVDPNWVTPAAYDAIDPTREEFYRPSTWWVMGRKIHSSRLMAVTTRELPDMLKPAYNFAGLSLSQLAQPYVDNWTRTRKSVGDLISNFSTTALSTSMDQILQGDDDGTGLLSRAKLFTLTKSNQGLMLLDKERESLMQLNAPITGLHELQAQAQEHMCSVAKIPAVIFTGLSPAGLNASSEGEIKVFYDWISAQQEAFWRKPIESIIDLVQISLYGEIDTDISFNFRPLQQVSPAELADIRLKEAQAASTYIDAGVIAPEEERTRLSLLPESGHLGISGGDGR